MRIKRRTVAASGAHTKRWWKQPIYKIFCIFVRALICHFLFLFIRLFSCTRRLDVWESASFFVTYILICRQCQLNYRRVLFILDVLSLTCYYFFSLFSFVYFDRYYYFFFSLVLLSFFLLQFFFTYFVNLFYSLELNVHFAYTLSVTCVNLIHTTVSDILKRISFEFSFKNKCSTATR